MEFEAIRSASILNKFTDDEFETFTQLAALEDFDAGQKIVAENEPINAFYMVRRGTVHVRRKSQKSEMMLGRIGAGGFFGEINLFDPGVATANIYAMDRVSLAVIDYKKLRAFLAENPAIGFKFVSALMTEVCRRLRQTDERFSNAMYWSSLNAPE